jgi:hypothetical protein
MRTNQTSRIERFLFETNLVFEMIWELWRGFEWIWADFDRKNDEELQTDAVAPLAALLLVAGFDEG